MKREVYRDWETRERGVDEELKERERETGREGIRYCLGKRRREGRGEGEGNMGWGKGWRGGWEE